LIDAALDEPRAPDPLIGRAVRLFSFLGQAQQLKNPSVSDLDSYRREGAVHWLHDLPLHPALDTALRRGTPDASDPVLSVDRVPRLDPPAPIGPLSRWLDGPIDDPRSEPLLRDELYVGEPSAGSDPAGPPTQHRVDLGERPEVAEEFERYQREWRAWAEQDLRDEPVRSFYGDLFSTYVSATGHPEELELVLGGGLLGWSPANHPKVRRHMLTVPVKILFDDDTGRLTVSVDETADGTRVELEMLDPRLVGNPQHVNSVRDRARSEQIHPLDRDRMGELARRLVHALSSEAEYRDDDVPATPTSRPVSTFAPALLLRKRSQQGLVEIFRRIVDQITASGVVPDGVLPLIDADHVPEVAADGAGERTDGALVRVDDEPFLPLPVNEMQLRILRQVDSHAQTLIQGPPGTGKTHTAAVLISHLLAQGKRVLVTAQTDRALKEVREKLPEAIRPLAVAIVGASREDMSDLRVAVERIAGTAAEHDPEEAQRSIGEHLDAIDELRRRRASLHHRLLDAREREVRTHDVAGYRGTLSAIAQQRDLQLPSFGWISEYIKNATGELPLTNEAIVAWRNQLLDATLATDEPHAAKRLVGIDSVVGPRRLADLAAAEERALQHAARFDGLRGHPAYAAVQRLSSDERAALADRLRKLSMEMHALMQRREQWVREALDDVRNGRSPIWIARRAEMAQLIQHTVPVLAALGSVTDVRVQGDTAGLDVLAAALAEHLDGGGKIKLGAGGLPKVGALSPRAVKQAAPLFEQVRVNGSAPCTEAQVRAFLTWTTGDRLLAALDRAWPANVVISPEDTLQERLQWHITELALLDRVLGLGAQVHHEEQRLSAAWLPHPNWNNSRELQAYMALPDAVATAEVAAEATRPLEELARPIADEERWPDAEPVVAHLLDAVRRRDHAAYAAAHERLGRLHLVRAQVFQRDEAGRILSSAVPALAADVLADPNASIWEARLPVIAESWRWAVAGSWIAEQAISDVNAVQSEINRIEDRIREHVQQLSATRAWGHAVGPKRLSRGSRASLEQYASLVRRFGKTGGQYREQRRAEIRDAMDRCRPAVPVWIMPLYRIADQLRIEPGMFDVVIVDEASQAGLEASFLQYLAPSIVVIGDDKQVSPSAVGVDQQQLRDLGNQYLYDDQFRATWQDPQRSLFDEAKMRFSGMLTLVEHRRCVPEIIGFSNRIAYEPDGVRLIPVRQFGADRLEPIRTVLVEDGYERGSSSSRINQPEVDAIVDQIEKCIVDPRYDGLTFGVISLLGSTQAKAIEKKLLERISPEEWTARDLRCGDAADFQGSERDVMFLSMVAAPREDRRIAALTANLYVQRYNVAASRAKDQMWLFHSVRLDDLSNPEDMRFQLLDYCYGVQKRSSSTDDRVVETALPEDVLVTPFQSMFEQRVCNRLIDRGYSVIPQFPTLGYSIDLVVTGARTRLAIECDGDHWHGPDAYQRDMARQRELERCGWHFFRVLESEFYLDPAKALAPLWDRLAELEIHPSGWASPAVQNEADVVREELLDAADVMLDVDEDEETELDETDDAQDEPDDLPAPQVQAPAALVVPTLETAPAAPPLRAGSSRLAPYRTFAGALSPVATASRVEIITGLVDIVAVEGPIMGHRLHSVYVRSAAGQKVGSQIARTLNSAVAAAVRQGRLIQDDPLGESGVKPRTFRLPDQPTASARELGPRTFDQIPPAELAVVMGQVAEIIGWEDPITVFRETIAVYGIRKLGSTIRTRLREISTLVPEGRASAAGTA
jgi:very-short-patch-repair endonuclease